MSGSNSICVSTVLLETGILPMQEPVTRLRLEAPGGLVDIEAQCSNGHVDSIRVTNVPSFVAQLDAQIEIEGVGTLTVDTAYGGDSFVIVDAKTLGFSLTSDEALDLASLGVKITAAATEQLGFIHPLNADWSHISFCQFAAPIDIIDGVKHGRNAVAIEPGKIDRSPTGTGCSARLAVLHARNKIAVGEAFVGVSIIDSIFHCRIEETTYIGDVPAIRPSISGRGFITGTHQHLLDPDDPWPQGYRLSDTWPGAT